MHSILSTGRSTFSRNRCSKLLQQHSRCASQLYPTTSQRWDDAMIQAESIVGHSSNFSNLQEWFSGEFSNIMKYLQKLVGTNHPMLETAKRCTYINEGKMGSAQARGLTVLLTAKAVEDLARYSTYGEHSLELIKNQISLAEMTEMTYSAYMIHRGVMDLKMHGLEAVDFDTVSESSHLLNRKEAKGLHYGNKVSVLCGDFLLSYVMRGLGDLYSSKVVDLVASAITEFMEGEFLLIDDWRSRNYLMTNESRDFSRWQKRSYSTIGCLQGNTCQAALVLANIEGKLELDAREFGKNLGLAWQAHTELQPFLRDTYEPIELPELRAFPAFDLNCLPVMQFLRNSHEKNKNYRLLLEEIKCTNPIEPDTVAMSGWEEGSYLKHQHKHQQLVDYEKLHSLVLNDDKAIPATYNVIRDYSQQAIRHLELFPPSEAKDVLCNIAESLYRN